MGHSDSVDVGEGNTCSADNATFLLGDHFLVVFDEAVVLSAEQELPSYTATLSECPKS